MPLTKCPECNKDVSTQAASCPHCGYPLTGVQDKATPLASATLAQAPNSKPEKAKQPKSPKFEFVRFGAIAVFGMILIGAITYWYDASTSMERIGRRTSKNELTLSSRNLDGFTFSDLGLTPSPDTVYPYERGRGYCYQLKVLQSVKGGVLICGENPPPLNDRVPDRNLFIKTKRQYADNDLLKDGYFLFTGLVEYKTVLGVRAKIYSFEEIDKP
jgi:hypothetical protein